MLGKSPKFYAIEFVVFLCVDDSWIRANIDCMSWGFLFFSSDFLCVEPQFLIVLYDFEYSNIFKLVKSLYPSSFY